MCSPHPPKELWPVKVWRKNIWSCPEVSCTKTIAKDSLGPVGSGEGLLVLGLLPTDAIRSYQIGQGNISGSLTCLLVLPKLSLPGSVLSLCRKLLVRGMVLPYRIAVGGIWSVEMFRYVSKGDSQDAGFPSRTLHWIKMRRVWSLHQISDTNKHTCIYIYIYI